MSQPPDYPPTELNSEALETLHAWRIDPAVWLQLYPYCDACGCPDDRCIGFHHSADEPDACDLTEWIKIDLEEGRVHRS